VTSFLLEHVKNVNKIIDCVNDALLNRNSVIAGFFEN